MRGRDVAGERSFRGKGSSSSLLSSPFTSSASKDILDMNNATFKYSKYLEAAKHRLTVGSDRGWMIVWRSDCSRTGSANCW
jgi:hypothetical protein